MLNFLKFLVNLHFLDQNNHETEFLKNILQITCKSITPHFGDFFQSNLICLLCKHESNRKNDNYQNSFLYVNFKDQNFQTICYIYALEYLPYLSKEPILIIF